MERQRFSWSSPFVIVGIMPGLTAVYIFYAGLTGRDLPLVSGEYKAFTALAAVMGLKLVIFRLHCRRLR